MHYHLLLDDENKIIDIPQENIDLNIPEIPACLNLHNIDVVVNCSTTIPFIKSNLVQYNYRLAIIDNETEKQKKCNNTPGCEYKDNECKEYLEASSQFNDSIKDRKYSILKIYDTDEE